MLTASAPTQLQRVNGQDLLVMLVWGVVGLAVTLRFFRWSRGGSEVVAT